MKKATLHTDGGSRGNPGPAAIGYALKIEGMKPIFRGEYIGKATNNKAEYEALARGMQAALSKKVDTLNCFLDSELVVKQVKGEYRMKNANLRPLYERILKMEEDFEKVTYMHVMREKNKEADAMVNKALDNQ